MKRKIRTSILGVLGLSLWASGASAALDFQVQGWTANSLTFTVTGDMSGYSPPAQYTNFLSIVYEGDIWSGNNYYPTDQNTWSHPVFEESTIILDNPGQTLLTSSGAYASYGVYSDTLANGSIKTSGQPITITFARGFLNPNATSGTVKFLWGYASTSFPGTELDSYAVGQAPSTTTSTTVSTTTTTAASTTTTTSASTTSTTSSTPTTTQMPGTAARAVPTLGAFGIPLLVALLGVLGLFGLYRRR